MSICLQEQYIELVIDKELYAMNTKDIYKMIKFEADETKTKPMYPNGEDETLYVHGKEVAVISLRQLFGIPQTVYTKAARIILVRHNGAYAGFVADQVNKVSTYEVIQKVSMKEVYPNKIYVSGVGQRQDRKVAILNTDELLNQALKKRYAWR